MVVDAENGCEVVLAIRSGGDLVGEMASLESERRSATVISCVKTATRLIPAEVFAAFLRGHPHAHYQVTRMLSQRLRFANDQRVAFASFPALARIARILLEVALYMATVPTAANGISASPLAGLDIAAFAGVSLSSAEKSLRRLQESEVITRRSRSVLIADMPGLRNFAAGLDLKP